VIPLFHVGGLNFQTTPALLAGATVTLHPRFEPAAWLSDVARLRPTTSVLVPATMQAVIADSAWPTADLSSLRMLVTGSAVVPPRLIEAFHARGVPVCQVYGLTETGPIAVHQRPEDALTHLGSTGLEAALTEARIVDADDRDVEGGRSGELLLRGPNVFRAYWRNATATESAFDNAGWFRTGDVGHRLPDGHIVIDDRVKDMVISGGENVYPAEVEQVLSTSPELQEVAVVGAPDERWGEVLVAVAVRVPGSAVSEADVLALCDGRLARFKQPRRVVFVDQLPRNAMGKVLKHELRAGLVAG
jgi:fatty-acyl-CoA synthase